MDKQNQSTKLY